MNSHRKRITIAGAWILGVAFVGGIAFTWLRLRSVHVHPDEPGFLPRSTILPLFFMFHVLKVTIPVLVVSGALIVATAIKQKLWWLSIVGFLAIGIYWLFWVLLLSRAPFD